MNTIKTVKLSELSNDEVVSFEDATYTLTVGELKVALESKEYDALEQEWYVVEIHTWHPDANRMIGEYIESEYQEMYEGWDELAISFIDKDVINKIQNILDETFIKSEVKNYWTLEKLILI